MKIRTQLDEIVEDLERTGLEPDIADKCARAFVAAGMSVDDEVYKYMRAYSVPTAEALRALKVSTANLLETANELQHLDSKFNDPEFRKALDKHVDQAAQGLIKHMSGNVENLARQFNREAATTLDAHREIFKLEAQGVISQLLETSEYAFKKIFTYLERRVDRSMWMKGFGMGAAISAGVLAVIVVAFPRLAHIAIDPDQLRVIESTDVKFDLLQSRMRDLEESLSDLSYAVKAPNAVQAPQKDKAQGRMKK